MNCKLKHDDEDGIPAFLCVTCNPRRKVAKATRLQAVWVDPVEERQRELRAAQAETAKARQKVALAKHLQKIEDEHPGEEWDRKNKMWVRTKRSMAKYEAKLQAEFEAAAKQEKEVA
jgi:hypothetical protein